jgi:dipeptidyl aminopeptidase/acylaminoacyl peptidase
MTGRLLRAHVVIAAVALLSTSPTDAQTPRPMTIVDVLEVPRVSDPQLSPDGRYVLYILERADWKANRRIGHIWRVGTDGSSPAQITNGDRGESSPRWSPDGRHIAFLARRGDAEENQIYVLSVGEAQQLSRHPTAVSDIAWAPDGRSIYFIAVEPKTGEEKERERLRDDVYAFEENFKHRHLWRVSVPDGTITRITGGNSSVLGFHIADDGRRIVLQRATSPLVGEIDKGEVWMMNADGSNGLQLTRNQVAERGARLSPDNSKVLFISGSSGKFETYHSATIFVIPSTGGDPQMAATVLPEVETAGWAKDGRSIYFVGNIGVRSALFELKVATRAATRLTHGDHALQNWSYVAAADRHVMQIDEPVRAGDVWTLVPSPGESPMRITGVYDELARQFALPRQERIEWKGADGVTVEGLLFYPTGYQPGQRYPLVVQTHGGPQQSDKFGFGAWNYYAQVLTGKGYAVFRPNYRGSTGYGDAFLRNLVGHYFHQSHLDVMTGVDKVIALGVADPDRLIKMGWSAGGHMTNKLITFTSRFKAASSGAGAANWVSMYAQSDTRVYRTPWFGGTPWQADAPVDNFWNDSPLKYIANVKTPTLFIAGEADVRVPSPQSVEMYRALKSNGVPTRLYMAPREPHGWTELRHQLFKINAELEWFEKYAMGRTHQWETAPGDPPRPAAPATF